MNNRKASALIVEDEPLLRAALRDQLSRLWPQLDTHREAADGLEAARLLAEQAPDVLFLDIHIPGLTGLDIARLASGRCHVVFVTAFQEHAVAAFDTGAVDFVVKPIDHERLAVTVARLRQRIETTPPDLADALRLLEASRKKDLIRWVQASVGEQIRIVPVEEVFYFQSDAKYTKVASERGDFHIRRSIKDLCEGLDPAAFWQVHRGTIVNVKRIHSAARQGEGMALRLIGRNERLQVSLPYQARFKRE